MKPLSVVVMEVRRCGVSVECGLLVVVVKVVVLLSKCGFKEDDNVVAEVDTVVVCVMVVVVVVFVATTEVSLVVVIDVGLTPSVVEVWVVALVVVVDGVVVGVNKYGVDTNCEDRVSIVVAGVVVNGNLYGVDEVSGECDSKVDVVSGIVVVDEETVVVEVDRVEDVVVCKVEYVDGKLVVVGDG